MNPIVNFMVTLVLLAFWSVAFVIFYHLSRFGVGVVPKRLAAVFLIGSVILFGGAIGLYLHIDPSFLHL